MCKPAELQLEASLDGGKPVPAVLFLFRLTDFFRFFGKRDPPQPQDKLTPASRRYSAAVYAEDLPASVQVSGTAAAWSRGRRVYGLTLLASFLGVGAAFVPSTIEWLRNGIWHMNVIYKFTNPFQRVVSWHAITGMGLLVLFALQVFSGVTGSPGGRRRMYHRIAGYFVVTPLIVISLGLASASEVAANLCCQEFQFQTVLITIIIFITFSLGIRAVRLKRFAEHKDWMMWTVLITSQVGFARIGMFVMQPFYRCDPFLSDWPFVFAVWLSNIAAFICLYSVGRIGCRYKANLFLLILQAAIGTYSAVTAMLFECPTVMVGNVTR